LSNFLNYQDQEEPGDEAEDYVMAQLEGLCTEQTDTGAHVSAKIADTANKALKNKTNEDKMNDTKDLKILNSCKPQKLMIFFGANSDLTQNKGTFYCSSPTAHWPK
jgi:hypothetical protein